MDEAVFSVAAWQAWSPRLPDRAAWLRWADGGEQNATDSLPALACLDPMQRRRLQHFGRMALETLVALGPNTGQPIVFGSRHGEAARSFALLEELAEGGAVSPQAFSIAVHNAVPGIYTIERGTPASVSALSAGPDTFANCLIEAVLQLADGAPEVWLCVCEEPLPDAYACFADEPQAAYAFALALRSGADFRFGPFAGAATVAPQAPALTFLRALLRGESATIASATSLWRLEATPRPA